MIKWTDSFEQAELSFSPQSVPAISSVGGKWGSIFNKTFKPVVFHTAARLCIYQTLLKHLLKVITVSNEVCRMCAQTWEGFVSLLLPIEITHVCVCLPSCISSLTPLGMRLQNITWISEKQWQQRQYSKKAIYRCKECRTDSSHFPLGSSVLFFFCFFK